MSIFYLAFVIGKNEMIVVNRMVNKTGVTLAVFPPLIIVCPLTILSKEVFSMTPEEVIFKQRLRNTNGQKFVRYLSIKKEQDIYYLNKKETG